MVEQVAFQTIFQFLQTVGILVGVFYYIMTIRTNQRNQEIAQKNQELQLESRNLQLFMQLYQQMSSPEAYQTVMEIMYYDWGDIDDFLLKYGERNNVVAYGKYMSIMRRYNTIGLLMRDKHIDPELLWDYIGDSVIAMWDKYGEIIREMRVRLNQPTFLEWFESLVNEMIKISTNRGFTEPVIYPWKKASPDE